MKAARALLIIFLIVISATSVAALPSWMVKLFGVCSDGDNGPQDLAKPLPFIMTPATAEDPDSKHIDECVDEKGEKKSPSTHIREYFCGKNGQVESKVYNCLEHGFTACVDTPRGAQCVRVIPTKCGDGTVQPPEKCDPPGVACMTAAGKPGVCNPGCQCAAVPPKKCGDKIIQAPEQCDPPGAACKDAAGNPGVCNPGCKCAVQPPPKKCGDKVVQPPEQCDPPGKVCKNPQGKIGTCAADCSCKVEEKPRCGDAKLDAGEQCDPPNGKCMNAAGLDAVCSKDCKCPVTRIATWCSNNRVDQWEDCDPPGVRCLKAGKVGICNDYCKCAGEGGFIIPDTAVAVGRQVPVTPQPPTTPQQPEQPKKSCAELCGERGMGTQPVDHSQYIMSYLQQYTCVSGASMTGKGTLTLTGPGIECKCYSKEPPQISVNSQPPVCNTPCGPVSCGQTASCPCPDKPNCTLRASCTWGGWKWEQNRAIPILGSQAATG